MIETYRETKIYPQNADKVFAYCLNTVRDIGADVESSDSELGIIHANYYLMIGLIYSGNIHVYILVTPKGEKTSEVAIETHEAYQFSRGRPMGKPREVGNRILSKVGGAVAYGTALARTGSTRSS